MKFGIRELLFVILLLAIPSGAYLWVFRPANQHIEAQRQAIESKDKKLLSLQRAMVGIKDLNEEVEKLKETRWPFLKINCRPVMKFIKCSNG